MKADPSWQAERKLFHGRGRWSGGPPSLRCASSLAFPTMPFKTPPKRCGSPGWPSTSRCRACPATCDPYQALNRVCMTKPNGCVFGSKGRGLDSVEGKRNDTGMRFVLHTSRARNRRLAHLGPGSHQTAIIDWDDPVIHHGLLFTPIKFVRLVRRKASSPRAQGADCTGPPVFRPTGPCPPATADQKPKHPGGNDIIGLDIGPSTLAIVPRAGEAPPAHVLRSTDSPPPPADVDVCNATWSVRDGPTIQTTMTHQRSHQASWQKVACALAREQTLSGYQTPPTCHLQKGNWQPIARACMASSSTTSCGWVRPCNIEKASYKGWQKRYGKSIGLRAPGMFLAQLETHSCKDWAHSCSEVSAFQHQTLAVLSRL